MGDNLQFGYKMEHGKFCLKKYFPLPYGIWITEELTQFDQNVQT